MCTSSSSNSPIQRPDGRCFDGVNAPPFSSPKRTQWAQSSAPFLLSTHYNPALCVCSEKISCLKSPHLLPPSYTNRFPATSPLYKHPAHMRQQFSNDATPTPTSPDTHPTRIPFFTVHGIRRHPAVPSMSVLIQSRSICTSDERSQVDRAGRLACFGCALCLQQKDGVHG